MRTSTRASVAFFAATLALSSITASPRLARAAGVDPGIATPVQREQAQARFTRGRELFAARKYDAALAEFQASLEIVASPNTRLYVARSLEANGDLVAAYVELGRTAIEARELSRDDTRYTKTAEVAAKEREALGARLGFVRLQIERAGKNTTVRVGGEDVKRAAWDEPVPVLPGACKVEVASPGHVPEVREIELAAGQTKDVRIDAAVDPKEDAADDARAETTVPTAPTDAPPRASLKPWAFAAGGVAVAGLATFVVAGSMARGTHADLERNCGQGPCSREYAGDVSTGRMQQTFANVGLVVGAAFGAAAVTLLVLDAKRPDAPRTAVVVGPSFVGVRGTL
jgi:hypothetical protein